MSEDSKSPTPVEEEGSATCEIKSNPKACVFA